MDYIVGYAHLGKRGVLLTFRARLWAKHDSLSILKSPELWAAVDGERTSTNIHAFTQRASAAYPPVDSPAVLNDQGLWKQQATTVQNQVTIKQQLTMHTITARTRGARTPAPFRTPIYTRKGTMNEHFKDWFGRVATEPHRE